MPLHCTRCHWDECSEWWWLTIAAFIQARIHMYLYVGSVCGGALQLYTYASLKYPSPCARKHRASWRSSATLSLSLGGSAPQ